MCVVRIQHLFSFNLAISNWGVCAFVEYVHQNKANSAEASELVNSCWLLAFSSAVCLGLASEDLGVPIPPVSSSARRTGTCRILLWWEDTGIQRVHSYAQHISNNLQPEPSAVYSTYILTWCCASDLSCPHRSRRSLSFCKLMSRICAWVNKTRDSLKSRFKAGATAGSFIINPLQSITRHLL